MVRQKRLISLALLPLLMIAGLGAMSWLMPTPASARPAAVIEIPLSGSRVNESSPAVADFNGDGYKEIVVGSSDGLLYVLSYNGNAWQPVWVHQTNDEINAANPPTATSDNRISASVAVADLDDNGKLEIVVAVGGDVHVQNNSDHRNGGILVYTYQSAWNFSLIRSLSGDGTTGWPQPRIDQVGWPPPGYSNPDGYWDGFITTPALGDLDGDGTLEIVALGIDRRIHAWHYDGSVVAGWPISQWDGDALWRGGLSSPALGDIDEDGLPEVVVGTMSPLTQDNTNKEGTIWAVNGDSTSVPGFPIKTEQLIHSSPALGDIDGDGHLEIVVGAGWGTSGRQNLVFAWNNDGTPLPNWPQQTAGVTMAPPALGDIDNDGQLEIVAGCGNNYDPSSCKWLYAWNADGSLLPGFPVQPPLPDIGIPGSASMPYSPLLVDFDGDNTVEILITHIGGWGVTVVEPTGTTSDYTTHVATSGLLASGLVDDIDNDGLLEIVVAGGNLSTGKGAVFIWNENGSVNAKRPWPMFHHDVARTGAFEPDPSLGALSSLALLHQSGSGNTANRGLVIYNTGGHSFDWQITHSIPELQSPTSGTSGTVESQTVVDFEVDTSGLGNGWTNLGNVTLTATAGGEPISGSPKTIQVRVYVGEVSSLYLPTIVR